MATTVRVVSNHFPQIADGMEAKAVSAVTKTAFDIEADAKELVVVDEGNLKGSIMADPQGLTAEVSANADYAARIEFGFVGPDSLGRVYNQAAQPYLRPAVDMNREAFEQAMAEIVSHPGGTR